MMTYIYKTISNSLNSTLKCGVKALLVAALLLSISTTLHAQGAANAAPFLDISYGARAAGMGQAFTSVANDGDAIYFNPAGMEYQEKNLVQFMNFQFLETNYMGLQYIVPASWGTFGLGYSSAELGGIEESTLNEDSGRLELTGDSFGYAGRAIYLSASSTFFDRLMVGGNFKIVSETLHSNSASGFGLDLGLIYKMGASWTGITDEIDLGLALRNIMPPSLKWDTEGSAEATVPTVMALGISSKFLDERLLASLDIQNKTGRDMSLHLGFEYWIVESLALRFGYGSAQLNLGAGLQFDRFHLDYSITMPRAEDEEFIENINRISLGFNFDPPNWSAALGKKRRPATKKVVPIIEPEPAQEVVPQAPPEPDSVDWERLPLYEDY
ncbi:MAG: PorV/PorQ family protein [bacterium]|nr:PorV/PorQ family protein [bacterium]